MKQFIKEFFRRGLLSAAGGPVILAIIYGILGAIGTITHLTPREVCLGILTITLLALFAGGMTAIYQFEQLPLLSAILIHGAGLYLAYILIYLINGWLMRQLVPILIFTAVFIAGYTIVWLCIYRITKRRADRISRNLRQQQT